MNELFGIPLDTLLLILAIGLGVAFGILAVLAIRNPVLVRLGVRNFGRRRSRTSLIVLGLMLGTTIVAAALVTGDTMSHTIRTTATAALGESDEVVSAKGAVDDIPGDLGDASGVGWFPESVAGEIRSTLGPNLADGVVNVVVDHMAVQAPRTKQSEPTVTLFGADPAGMKGFSPIVGSDGSHVSLADLSPGQAYLNTDAADELGVRPGDTVIAYPAGSRAVLRVRDVVEFNGAATADAALLLPLEEAQLFYARYGQVLGVMISNRGSGGSAVALSDAVERTLTPTLQAHDLELQTIKQDAIESADEAGSAFMAFFTTFGSFSIAAGILLIFLIFVMLAAERRGELGIARAVGTRRGHLTQMFTFEGAAYDVVAAIVGAILGAIVAFGMVFLMAKAFGAENEDAGLQVEFAFTWQSLLIAFALGVLLTLVVVAFSAWRVSTMTIATAIRNLPEPPVVRPRRRIVLGGLGGLLGVLLVLTAGNAATPLMLGVSLFIVSLVPLARLVGIPDRIAYTVAGLTMVVLLLLPWSMWESVFGPLAMDFSTWIVSGLMIVVGAVWVIVYNADLLLGAMMAALGRIKALTPLLRMSMAYPLKSRFRTGTTLAMFTLVVFTLVTGSTSTGSFQAAFNDVDTFGGGFDIRAGTGARAAIPDMGAALRERLGARASDYPVVGSQSVLAVDARQLGTGRPFENYHVRGLDSSFLSHTTFQLGSIARGYTSSRDVWMALQEHVGLAVVDSLVVQRRDNFGFNVMPSDFKVTGFYADEGKPFDPVPVEVLDKQTGEKTRLTIIGVLSDSAPFEMSGISSSQSTLAAAFPGRAEPTIHYFSVAPGIDPGAAAQRLESAFITNGLEAESIQKVVQDSVAANKTFNRLIQGFMALGLVVGVAALGVISARAVVERRQQIGVMRAIGFRRTMIQTVFLLESSFVALTAIVVGTGLGLLLGWNIIEDSRKTPSWANLEMVVPWGDLVLIFVLVYAVALLATLAPAIRASRIAPAEALRYE
ncbi:ABC transporter permease [Gaiella sp.]|uniref:ABC transporter permease n=1 Tax=Gaiella sp. TaxID=2663207 RepID=UPI002D0D853D|nr:FtsX-like permease family protein [Gaiella sp.]HWO81099.1 FtsX-like permease family protein [Gaiella sp.]